MTGIFHSVFYEWCSFNGVTDAPPYYVVLIEKHVEIVAISRESVYELWQEIL